MNVMPVSEVIVKVAEVCKKKQSEETGSVWFFCNWDSNGYQ